MTQEIVRTPFSRVFLMPDGAGPSSAPEYQSLARAGAVDFSLGDLTPIRKPSADQYGVFQVIDSIRGQPDLPTLPIEARYRPTLSDLLEIANRGCEVDVHVHFGLCQNPEDFDGGWDKQLILEQALATNYGTTELGALDADQDATVEETVPFSGQRLYEVKTLTASEQGATVVVAPVVDIAICDSISCGQCGIVSDGCTVAFALSSEQAASPGLGVKVLYTVDGGATWNETTITTLGAGNNANALACVGTNLMVISEDTNSHHLAPINDILAGNETWVEITAGYEVLGLPKAIISVTSTATWVVGANGTIYFTSDPNSGVTVQTTGSITTETFNAVHAINTLNVIAVATNNVVAFTENGGTTWALSASGPAPGIDLNAVFARSDIEWLVGTDDGNLYFTQNRGVSWTLKAFPGSGGGRVTDLSFASRNVGYMAHATATPDGRVLRTTNGGFSWVVMPEVAGLFTPANNELTAIAPCVDDVNVVYSGGIASDGTDGIIVKFA